MPAVPTPASEQGSINRPAGAVSSVPAGTVASSSEEQTEHAHSLEEPLRRIRRDRPVGQQAEYERRASQDLWNSAAASEASHWQQQASGAAPDCGQGAENCAGEQPDLQGCEACLRKHQQPELAILEAKGSEDVLIGLKKAEGRLQVGHCKTIAALDSSNTALTGCPAKMVAV